MKKNLKALLMLGIVVSVGFTACEEEETTPTPTPNPTDTSAVLVEKTNGVVWNFQGPNQGAFDLVAETGVSSTASNTVKDLVDNSTVGTSGVVFPKTWSTSNGTTFVKAASTFDYAGATLNKAETAFDAGTATSSTGVLAVGDIYIASNARFANDYVVIKITAVTETASDNLDKIEFTYKK